MPCMFSRCSPRRFATTSLHSIPRIRRILSWAFDGWLDLYLYRCEDCLLNYNSHKSLRLVFVCYFTTIRKYKQSVLPYSAKSISWASVTGPIQFDFKLMWRLKTHFLDNSRGQSCLQEAAQNSVHYTSHYTTKANRWVVKHWTDCSAWMLVGIIGVAEKCSTRMSMQCHLTLSGSVWRKTWLPKKNDEQKRFSNRQTDRVKRDVVNLHWLHPSSPSHCCSLHWWPLTYKAHCLDHFKSAPQHWSKT